MWRKFTVYGLRFSKTSFWNRMNTGFLDPAVATVLTACGIETYDIREAAATAVALQQCLPLAVLKPSPLPQPNLSERWPGCNSAYRLRY